MYNRVYSIRMGETQCNNEQWELYIVTCRFSGTFLPSTRMVYLKFDGNKRLPKRTLEHARACKKRETQSRDPMGITCWVSGTFLPSIVSLCCSIVMARRRIYRDGQGKGLTYFAHVMVLEPIERPSSGNPPCDSPGRAYVVGF